ncbi:MBL fold metallo-hydrolase [Serratia marcescens]|uniref:MBL fold metallo-hydrolase n=1 Tax=Serratia marcescens TaxID=615 RepID=UPI00069DC440|nr:MBL fold metallo-hydrolase [Serratia marcescens]HAT5006012.1 MBL fold metallo-hydrolase [Serratia marcescens]
MKQSLAQRKTCWLLAAAGLLITSAAPAETNSQAPGYYRMPLGKMTVTAVSDGTVTLPLEQLLTNISPETLQKRLADDGISSLAETSINTFVIDTGKQKILIDAGAGSLIGKTGGHLLDNLREAGYPPESIDAVLITHIHSDHSGGISLNGKPAFPNAQVYVEQKDAEFWLNPAANLNKVSEDKKGMFNESVNAFNPIKTAGKLRTFNAPATLVGGIRAFPAPGHTPGSVIYRVESEGQSLIFWGDLVHVKAVQMPDPKVAIHFDFDQPQAIKTRERILAQIAKEGSWVGAAHFSFPGFGHVKTDGNGYRWIPANYTIKVAQ